MNYTQTQFKETKLDVVDYMTLKDPIFEGQTPLRDDNTYIMYFSSNGILYGFTNTL